SEWARLFAAGRSCPSPFAPPPSRANAPTPGAQGGAPAAPRAEIRPQFSFDAKGGPEGSGALVITADDRDGLHGWWQRTFPVTGGKHYRLHAVRKVHDIPVPRRAAAVPIVWQDDAGKPGPTD